MGRIVRILSRILIGLVVAILGLGLAIAGYGVASSYLAVPKTAGDLSIGSLSAPVNVTRDKRGVPWIAAQSAADAYTALGYVHAQDRFFQMELMRRAGQGRLAEVLGPLGVNSDKFMRTLGLYRLTADTLTKTDPEILAIAEAYSKGVNAFLANESLPMELKLLMVSPEPWTPADSFVWQRLMGLQLSGNWPEELVRAGIYAKLGPDKARELWPDVDARSPSTIAALSADFAARLRTAMLDVVVPSTASNIWALSPSRTATGGALLANDPHLGFSAPNLWYMAGLSYPGLTLTGMTVPGVPFHLLGHNGSLAWGFTTTHGDTQDLFVETLADGGYRTPDGTAQFTTREETINVRFGKPLTITVRQSRHGPIISDILPPADVAQFGEGKVAALSATLLTSEDRTLSAIYNMGRATTVTAFRDAVRDFHSPQQNVMFADTQGGIGYAVSGRAPIRKDKSCDGLLPADGATGNCDWIGWAAFEDMPQSLNPANGVLINANNKIVPDDFPVMIAAEWQEGYRAQRIVDVLGDSSNLTMQDMDKLQHDNVSLLAREMLPLLLERFTPTTERDSQWKARLSAWDSLMTRERTEPIVFALWMENLKSRLLKDELGAEYNDFRGGRSALITTILTDKAQWCDNVQTPTRETCPDQVNAAWADSMAWLDRNAGSESNWAWGQWHVATFGHPVFGNLPGFSKLGGFRASTDGDDATVNRGSFTGSTSRTPFRHRHGPGVRAIYDLADLSKSQFSLAGGQSAHMASPHLDDLMDGWANNQMFPLAPPPPGSGQLLILKD
jgi:penicillin G amidase